MCIVHINNSDKLASIGWQVESSDVSATEAASFLERVQQKHNPDASAADKLVAADQDDFDDMEWYYLMAWV